jgi:hypothetical protein
MCILNFSTNLFPELNAFTKFTNLMASLSIQTIAASITVDLRQTRLTHSATSPLFTSILGPFVRFSFALIIGDRRSSCWPCHRARTSLGRCPFCSETNNAFENTTRRLNSSRTGHCTTLITLISGIFSVFRNAY